MQGGREGGRERKWGGREGEREASVRGENEEQGGSEGAREGSVIAVGGWGTIAGSVTSSYKQKRCIG